jgi:cardiolipin synthase
VEGPCVSGQIDGFCHSWYRKGGRKLATVKDARCLDGGAQNVRVLGENYSRHRREIMQAYLYNIYRAKKRVWITNSYFLPDHTVVRALRRAARRGVDVRVLLPGVSDVEVVRHATRAMWGWLMRAGVRLYEFMPSILHSKSAVIDGRWSTTGTFNLDYRSIRANLEVNVAVLDEGFAQVMEASFLRDLEQSREVDARAYAFRSLGDRLLEMIFYGLRRFL